MQPQGVLFGICCLVGSTLPPAVTEELLPNGSSNRRSCGGGEVVGGNCCGSRYIDEEICDGVGTSKPEISQCVQLVTKTDPE